MPASPAVPGVPKTPGTPSLRDILLSRGYLKLLGLSLLLGIPIALACFLFVSVQHAFQHAVWTDLPRAVGYDEPPWWWPLPALLLAGLVLAPIVTRVPGGGGHLPVHGLGGTPLGPRELPGVVAAALISLPLGVVLGPEAPLMALGSGLALLAVRESRRAAEPKAAMVLATSGSTAAISTILGGPLVAAVMIVEAAGLAGPQLVVLLLPCLLASGVGALVFTGFGEWTGFSIGALELPSVPPNVSPDAGDFLWGVPVAVLIGVVVTGAHRLGYLSAAWTARHTAVRTVVAAVAVGVLLTAYALITGRSPAEAALSGQATLGALAAAPHSWSVAALLVLVACKGLAWGICLGALRGGPIFPAVLLGAALGVACAGLPGLGATPALALGMATASAVVTRLPVTSAVLAALLLGPDAANQTPLIAVCAVVGFVTAQFLERPRGESTAPDGKQ
ncbi:chloride channel protein [Streptomyces yaizuensis]|uniref:Chloride channel protein n=1 Tax=Streptomyces yaizuensis TaxID=2989713 RepID=A0ABQ5NZP0_9ACTN|nr:chloride channel protein [Streptomyces sp. YSPA8]GLF95830.1 chloride channel protein [Streptomyces sp. YSPA8]